MVSVKMVNGKKGIGANYWEVSSIVECLIGNGKLNYQEL